MGAVRLASLTLEGFKSFAARAELSFPGMIIAIVGPNGSGKSNIADSIAWVLGEQSARLLRSQTMADVIFAGSPRRPPLAGAAVTLHLAALDGRWDAAGGRLEISRRVLRDGSSDYRIGGRRARLKDVLDHLYDAGLGTRAYAIIEQGRIGQVLSVRATERRALFEEAAGITKFRARRHEAELKLAETRANVLRLNDVASEVRRALENARRQARRAEKHRELGQRLLAVRAALLAARQAALEATLEERRSALASTSLTEVVAARDLAAVEASLERARRQLDEVQERLAQARDDEARANAAAQRREAEEVAARRENADACERRQAATAQTRQLAEALKELATREASLVGAVEAAESSLVMAETTALQAQTSAGAAEQTSREATARVEEARRVLLKSVTGANEAKNRVHRLEVELEQASYQQSRLTAEHERLAGHVSLLAAREQSSATQESESAARATAAEQDRRAVRCTHEQALARAAELSAARDRVGHERWQAHHEREGLRRAIAASSALPQVLAKALEAQAIRGTVADFLAPTAEVARALDRAYGELLSLPVVADEEAASRLIQATARTEGRLHVVVASQAAAVRPSPLLERAGVDSANLGWLSAALPRASVAATDEEAVRLTTEDPDLVVVLPGGGRRRGTRLELPGGRIQGPGVLELRLREREAAAAEAAATTREREIETRIESTRLALESLGPRLQAADTAVREATEALATAASTRQALHREHTRLERESEALLAEVARLGGEVESLQGRLATGQLEAERLAGQATRAEAEVDELARDAERARDAAAVAAATCERQRGAAALARERLASAGRELERHRHELQDLEARRQAAQGEIETQHARAEVAAKAAVSARADLEHLLAQRTADQREAERLALEVDGIKERVAAIATEAEGHRRAHLAARDAAHAAELAIAEAQGAWERLQETIALTLADRATLPEEAPAPEALAGLEVEEAGLAADLVALGPINELAVAERDELEERHRFLSAQRRDLESSLASLGDTIRELDATCATRFLTTLEEANVAFDATFRTLFGGGEARAELSDPDAPLDSGIEIRVRPPGKHAQSVLLLSGGEKALAAVALLLALFRIRPAPFCLLDEVDAPLDDANVERLCALLHEMSAQTQFLLITHNRRTMAHADVLYGVTMEEPGVSRIVSVRLEE